MFYAAEGGGVSTYLDAKAAWLAQCTAIKHTILAPSRGKYNGDPSCVGMQSMGIPGVRPYRMPLSIRGAAQQLRSLHPTLIEVGDPYQCAWAALQVKRELQLPIVAFCHSDLPQVIGHRFGQAAQRAATRYFAHVCRQFDLVLAPSQVTMHRLQQMGISRVRHQPLGVDTAVFSPVRRHEFLRMQLGLPRATRLLVYAGRFVPAKKLTLLIDAVHQLGKPYHLLMIGSGDALPASSQISHFPFQHDPCVLAQLIASCDLMVHPGDRETFGLAVLEAMACGIPVLGTSAGGVAELIDADCGLLVPPGNVDKLAEGIDALYQRDITVLGAQARQTVMQKYDWNVILPQLLGHYAALLPPRQRTELEAGAVHVAN
jgi:alpha-1,6-mannosyltransferase